jgi:hypothetical protein
MTSVRNLLPRLSGTNIVALLSAVVLLSCNAFKVISTEKPADTPTTEETKGDSRSTEDTNTGNTSGEATKTYETVEFFGEQFVVESHKASFKAALILPFNIKATTKRELRTREAMLEYYQGVKAALNQLENQGLKMQLYVFDNEGKESTLKSILSRSKMKSMDIIIGPLQEDHIALVSEFGLKHDIPVMSPFATLDSAAEPNNKLYCSSPSLSTKAMHIASYIERNYSGDKVLLMSDNKSYAKRFQPILMKHLNEELKGSVSVVDYASVKWGQHFIKDEHTVVYVMSHNPTIVSTTMSRIYQTKRDVTVFGENSWSNFTDNDYNFWDKLDVHLVASDFVLDTTESARQFRLNYRLVNLEDPGVYAYLGYDQFKFMGDFLMAFGEHFPLYINDREFRYLSSNFKFSFIDGLNQNTNVFILKFEDFELVEAE